LVPCRADFRGEFYSLFWEKEDYQAFKEDALQELRAHWIQHNTTVKEAIFALYQPSREEPVAQSMSPPLLTHVDSMGAMAHLLQAAKADGLGMYPPVSQAISNAAEFDDVVRLPAGFKPPASEPIIPVGDLTDSEEGESNHSSSSSSSNQSPTPPLQVLSSSSRSHCERDATTAPGIEPDIVSTSPPALSLDGRTVTGVLAAAVVSDDLTPPPKHPHPHTHLLLLRDKDRDKDKEGEAPSTPSSLSSPVGAADIVVDEVVVPSSALNSRGALIRRDGSGASLASSNSSGSPGSSGLSGGNSSVKVVVVDEPPVPAPPPLPPRADESPIRTC
jgi:hypothetical protein